MTSQEERARAERLIDGHSEDGGGIRPAVVFADHSYPAYSRKQMIEFALALAAEVREDAAKVAEECVISLPGFGYGLADGASLARTQIAAAIRARGDGRG